MHLKYSRDIIRSSSPVAVFPINYGACIAMPILWRTVDSVIDWSLGRCPWVRVNFGTDMCSQCFAQLATSSISQYQSVRFICTFRHCTHIQEEGLTEFLFNIRIHGALSRLTSATLHARSFNRKLNMGCEYRKVSNRLKLLNAHTPRDNSKLNVPNNQLSSLRFATFINKVALPRSTF